MEYRRLGKTGLEVSAIAFGGAPAGLTNYLDAYSPAEAAQREQVVQAIVRALELGVTYFDTALAYGDGESERIYGEARRRAGELGRRMILATKTPASQRAYEAVLQSAETSLRNLGVDTIDVLQFHGSVWREAEVAAVLSGGGLDAYRELQRQGKVRFVGFTSETCSPGTYELVRSGAFDVLQIAYNVFYQDACNLMVKAGPIVEAKEREMGVVTMRSLSSGVFQKWLGQQAPAVVGAVDGYALALQYVLSNPLIDSALVGMRTAAEVERNVRLVDDTAGRVDLAELHVRYV
jgi:aryl-alcohol dehydrogenase-like predicted oxidoreductase